MLFIEAIENPQFDVVRYRRTGVCTLVRPLPFDAKRCDRRRSKSKLRSGLAICLLSYEHPASFGYFEE